MGGKSPTCHPREGGDPGEKRLGLIYMKQILITGSNGFTAKRLSKYLKERYSEIVILGIDITDTSDNEHVDSYAKVDVSLATEVNRFFSKNRFETNFR